MESDKNILEPKNLEQVGSSNSAEGEQVAKNYIEMATSMPVISGALSYISSTYNSVKENNETVAPLMDGVERSVERVASAAFNITKQVAGSNYMENLTCKGLDKNDSTDQNLPSETTIWNNKISQTIFSVSNKALDATVTAVDSYLTPDDKIDTKDNQNEKMSTRLSSVAGKARKRIVGMVSDSSDAEHQQDSQAITEDTSENKRWLFKVYKNLQAKPKNESLILSILRFTAIISVKASLTIQEAVIEPNRPLIERTFFSVVQSAKKESFNLLKPIRNLIDRAIIPLKSISREALDSSLEKSREFLGYIKGIGLQMTVNAFDYAKTLPSKAYKELTLRLHELSNSSRESSSTVGNVATVHQD